MDTNMEDKMYHQIEKSLSNNINENLFTVGKVYDKEKLPMLYSSVVEPIDLQKEENSYKSESPEEAHEYLNQTPAMSRAEYIKQAREACLRQLSSQSIRIMDTYPAEIEEPEPTALTNKKARTMKLFGDGEKVIKSPWGGKTTSAAEDSLQDIASFHSLVIRMVCAIVLFLCVFLIDKFDFQLGTFSKELVREYITGKDYLKQLEEIVVTWLK
jgi:hypothetical protein